MWILYALLAAFFAGITSVFAKIGVNKIDTDLATGIRTIVIIIFSFVVVIFTNGLHKVGTINSSTIFYISLSGLTTALLWICYFRALFYGDVNKVTPVDKTSIVLTLILSKIFLKENITYVKLISIILILLGTYLMIEKKENVKSDYRWFIYSVLTGIFTSLSTIVGKIGIKNVDVNLATFIRTIIVLIIIWIYIFIKNKHKQSTKVDTKSLLFIFLSGFTTGLSWLCYFNALKNGEASIVFPIEKLSILVAVLFSTIFLKEKLSTKSAIGLSIISIGTLILII